MLTIKVKRGSKTTLPTLEAGELAATTDTHRLYLGDGTENHLIGAGGNALVVAAFDTPTIIKDKADYICDGTADESEINTALGIVDTVILTEGTFNINASIALSSSKTLIGSGIKTLLKGTTTLNEYTLKNSNQTDGNSFITIRDISFDNSLNIKNFIDFYKGNDYKIENCYFNDSGDNAIALSYITNLIIINCTIKLAGADAFYVNDCSNVNIISNTVIEAHEMGIMLNASYCNIIGNIVQKSGWEGIHIEGANNNIDSNIVYASSQAQNNSSADFLIKGNYNNIQGNVARAGSETNKPKYGIEVDNGTGNRIINNDLTDDGFGTVPYYDGGTGTIFVDALQIRKNTGTYLASRPKINFIEGTNTILTVENDANETDVTINASILCDTVANRPAAAITNRFFWATDEHILYRDTGTAWVKTAVADHADLDGIGAYDHHPHTNKEQLDLVTDGDHDVRTDNPHTTSDANLSVSDVTTNNVSTSKHGFMPKAPNDLSKIFKGDGTWSTLMRRDFYEMLRGGQRFIYYPLITYDMFQTYKYGTGDYSQAFDIATVSTGATAGSCGRQNINSQLINFVTSGSWGNFYVYTSSLATASLAFVGSAETLFTETRNSRIYTGHHAGFFYEDGQWYISCGNGTAQTISAVTISADMHGLEIRRTASGLEFYVDKVLKGTLTTNLPSSPGYLQWFVHNKASTKNNTLFFYGFIFGTYMTT